MNRLFVLALPFATSVILAAEPDDRLVLDNGGLKNLYRLVFREFDESTTTVFGALEIRSYDPDELHTRIPFSGTIRFEDDGPERIELSPNLMVSFAAPQDPSNPKPPKPQTIRGLFHGWGTPEPGVSLDLWDFDPGSGNWNSYTMNFGKVPGEGGAADPAVALDKESLGGIRLGASAEQVKRKVGKRLFFGEEVFWGAIGEFGQPWLAPDQGVEFQMFRTTKKEEPVVGSITVSGKSAWKTARGIGIGDPRAAVEERYRDIPHEDPNEPVDKNELVVGSIYGGLIFSFDGEGKVSGMFLGAAAE